jgi:hypothetical protein
MTQSAVPKYLLAELDVSDQNHAKFIEAMPELIELMTTKFQWELVYASYPITGRLNRFVHIWKIGSEQTVLSVMLDGAVGVQPKGDLAREFNEAYTHVQKYIGRTSHALMAALPHDPTRAGNQTETVIIDRSARAWIFNNSKLKKMPVLKLTPALEFYLANGVTSAELDDALFFNLAALKPVSVFQQKSFAQLQDFAREPMHIDLRHRVSTGGGSKPDVGRKKLLLAAPWGRTYEITQTEAEQLFEPIPNEARSATETRLTPFRAAHVPLASIPTPMDQTPIGEGCLCSVVNLTSFERPT